MEKFAYCTALNDKFSLLISENVIKNHYYSKNRRKIVEVRVSPYPLGVSKERHSSSTMKIQQSSNILPPISQQNPNASSHILRPILLHPKLEEKKSSCSQFA